MLYITHIHHVTTRTTYNFGYRVAFLGEIIDLPSNSQDVVVQPTLVKGHVVGGCFDLPAHALVRNSMQFNGEYGCTFCEQHGETVRTGRGAHGHVLAFPFDEKNPDGPHRTAATIKQYSVVAVEENQVVSHCIYIIVIDVLIKSV